MPTELSKNEVSCASLNREGSTSMNSLEGTKAAKVPQFLELTKPRLAFLSTLTGMAGYLAAPDAWNWWEFTLVSFAIFLAACGALALNQHFERKTDALMERTKERPLPSLRMQPQIAFIFGLGTAFSGVLLSWIALPGITTLLIAATILSYLLVYTPLKSVTSFCTHLGAIPGALPPLIGWSAATGQLHGLGLWLFAIVLLWQMPHFFAIAWLCREDYQRGGIRVLPVTHPNGKRLLLENYFYLILLFPITLGPVWSGNAGWFYGGSAILLNAWFLFEGYRFAISVRQGETSGNRLFLFSLVYLPLLFCALLLNLR